jgi:hypothetical protein
MITTLAPSGREIRKEVKRLVQCDENPLNLVDRLTGYCIRIRNQVTMDSHPTPLRDRANREKRSAFYLGLVLGIALVMLTIGAALFCSR